MASSTLDSILLQHYNKARSVDFPAFIDNKATSTPLNSAPYITHLSEFSKELLDPVRHSFRAQLIAAIDELRESGILVEIVLIGGSFLDTTVTPGDLDCVLFYSVEDEQFTLDLQQWQLKVKDEHLDARLIPVDTNPLFTLKAALFFAVLYTQRKTPGGLPTGLILIDCKR
ncbi:hypothetical protein I9018_18395 [Pseudomonas sp. MPFS]|uniref:DUF6932 family protein n=1 Tax=Pseudomonas sp. MPFS TaxID=2795724 RepID=UPI001F134116|nr:hypothetical protein [Pseudomonas sp. MPFS]UMZ09507.1 hypothetical protein I9018_18395 [Pseudomonas sp. MPFS]